MGKSQLKVFWLVFVEVYIGKSTMIYHHDFCVGSLLILLLALARKLPFVVVWMSAKHTAEKGQQYNTVNIKHCNIKHNHINIIFTCCLAAVMQESNTAWWREVEKASLSSQGPEDSAHGPP